MSNIGEILYGVLELVQEHGFECWRRASLVNNVQDREEEGGGGVFDKFSSCTIRSYI